MNPEPSTSATEFETQLHDAQELLSEVIESAAPDELVHRFASVWNQAAQWLANDDPPESQLQLFNEGMDALRRNLEASELEASDLEGTDLEDEPAGSDDLQRLLDQAVEVWGSQLSLDEEWHDESLSHRGEDSDDTEVVAPDAAAVAAMLAGLGTPDANQAESDSCESNPPPPANPPTSDASQTAGEVPTTTIQSLDGELRDAFLDDAGSCLAAIEQAVLRLESQDDASESIASILRELHTLKGASASVGLGEIADQVHQWEESLREDAQAERRPAVDQLLTRLDAIRGPLGINSDQFQADNTPAVIQPSPGISQDNSVASPAADDEPVRVRASQLNRLMDMLAELVMLRNRRDTEVQALQQAYHELIGSVSKMRLLSHEEQVRSQAHSSLQLSEIANDVLEVAQSVRQCVRPVAEGNAAVSSFIRQFRQELVELRRSPVAGLHQRLQRSVREAAIAEQKEVRFELVGQDAGIERSMQQRLYEPLLHIVRNAVCHGIESPQQRVAKGKPAVGTITLRADSGPDLLLIEIQDDGGGLDFDAIRRRGVQQGLLATDRAASEQELSQLIFHPGFSTRQTADQNAGRGVGMDVVAATIQRLRGWIEIDSVPNRGTTLRMSFPLPSLVQHAMVFRAGDQRFALPMQSVQRAGEIDGEVHELSLSSLIQGQPVSTKSAESGEAFQRIVLACDSSSADRGAPPITLLVDEILGPEEVVVRPLPPLLRTHPFISGATLSGMGQPVLLLDARRLVESQRHHFARVHARGEDKQVSAAARKRPRILVADDSLSARKRVVRSLKRYCVDVCEVSDGKQALDLIRTEPFDALLSDMEMPHLGGMELLNKIRNETDLQLPVVIISSRDEPSFTERAAELGAVDYLIKPLAEADLDRAIGRIAPLKHLAPAVSETVTGVS